MIYSLFLLYVQLKVNKNIKFKVLNTLIISLPLFF